ncbi:hypothetical protein [Papillibacter cinnamivorans]|uniref:Uncharacterized protein n=1 Tax=Papillibacter cinnamivorans DSM 12816 TaxID=1122930 RepID=A0A1W2AH05_9FIRM|nr:hypothetical protein [Papillibacter cinnamivorans]SMC59967.1 hypothetical protein SAMN02745168_1716 [Papillibacter cinnamivorans DSM 12816]
MKKFWYLILTVVPNIVIRILISNTDTNHLTMSVALSTIIVMGISQLIGILLMKWIKPAKPAVLDLVSILLAYAIYYALVAATGSY